MDSPTSTTAQLLTVPPYAIAACVSLIIPWWSDRRQARGVFIIFVPFVAVLGFLLLALVPWVWRKNTVTLLVLCAQLQAHHSLLLNHDRTVILVRYLAVTLVLCGMVPTLSILTSWLTNNCVGHAKRATALAMLVSSGGLASMAGTQVYRSNDAPRYRK